MKKKDKEKGEEKKEEERKEEDARRREGQEGGGGGALAVAPSRSRHHLLCVPVPPTSLPPSHQLRARTRYIHRAVVLVGLRAIVIVGLRAVVIDCRSSCRFFYKFWKPHRAGVVLPKIYMDTNLFAFYAGEGPVRAKPEYLGDPGRLCRRAGLPTPRRLATAPTRHSPASLTPPPPSV
jgi:hypothetical protein